MKIPRVVHTLIKEVRNNLTEYEHYLIAVSGGADSLALADICANLREEGYACFTVCHVEHGIRGQEAIDDMDFVQAYCQEKKLPFVGIHVDVLNYAKRYGVSIEDAARKLRYDALRKIMYEVGASKILTAHQADDQAETVLWRMLRGAGLDGLAGMRMVNGDIVRPLLNIGRNEILEYLSAKGLDYRIDSTNADLNFTRNKIRQELLPYLSKNYNEKISDALSRTAKTLSEDADSLEALAKREYTNALVEDSNHIVLDARKLLDLLPAICKRVIRFACFNAKESELDYERTQAIYSMLIRNTGNKMIELPHGVMVTLKNHKLIFSNKNIK